MRLTRSAVILALGFFAIVAQTLLFRDFLTAFEGNELGVGSFFASWLLWVALGALAGRLDSRPVVAVAGHFELAALLYIPTYLLQHYLIAHARDLGGVPAYEAYPFAQMFAVSGLANAPISFVTGFLFTLACRRVSGEHALPVARVYILETFGSFAGGIAVTLLLAQGKSAEFVFLVAALVLVAGAAVSALAWPRQTRRHATLSTLTALTAVIPLLLMSGFAGWWAEHNNRAAWGRLLPAQQYDGTFTTAQSKYSFGRREGQFIVISWGGVSETLPNTEHASEVLALSLAQNPTARRILVVGPGSLSLCARFASLPHMERITWLHPDPDYPTSLVDVLPDRYRHVVQRIEIPGQDTRQFLKGNSQPYDLVLLNLPDATTLVLNRYGTREFFLLLKGSLAEKGVVCARVSGAANYMGGELAHLGGSALQTLESVFHNVVLKPGDESWLIASDSPSVSSAPAVLRDRFASLEGAAALYPPEGLFSLYVPDRVEFQLSKYRQAAAETGRDVLVNTDRRPKALLFSMLLALRRAQFLSLTGHLPVLLTGGVWMAACPVLLYGLLRLIYLLAAGRVPVPLASDMGSRVFDGYFLIFSTGLVGMSLSVVLMFLYQSHFGSLFLHMGLISSLFMLGSCAGSLLSERLLIGRDREPRFLLGICLLAHLLLLGAVVMLPGETSRILYVALFAVCGVFVGIYFPIAAHRLRRAGRCPAAAGSNLEILDHTGGALGAVLAGWLLLPVLGDAPTAGVLALLVGVNLIPLFARPGLALSSSSADWFDRLVRPAGYSMVGIAVCALIISHIAASVQTGRESQLIQAAAGAMTEKAEMTERHASFDDGAVLTYFTTDDSVKGPDGFVFGTSKLAEGIYGYGGPIVLAVHVDGTGTLRGLRMVRSHETPAYMEGLGGWLETLPGNNLFKPSPFERVDAVSGATMTSEAILRTLEQSGRRFASGVLGIKVGEAQPQPSLWLPDREFLCLLVLLILAVAARQVPGRWRRRGFLVVSLLLTGVLFNLQYSTQHVLALAGGNWPGAWHSGSFFLVLLVPVAVLLFGNVYCGYVCPFGALQELVGDLRPARWATDPEKQIWRFGRAVKYVLLLLLVLLFALTRDYSVLSADPLITVFSTLRDRTVLVVGMAALVFSFVFRRFWCRNLCPAGAFLALLCGLRLLKAWRPRAGPARCDLGVRTVSEGDCLCCDRCRHEEA